MGGITMFATAAAAGALGLLLVAPSKTYAYALNTPPPDVAPEYHTVFNDPTAALNPKHNRLCYGNALVWLAEWPIPFHCTARVAHQASAFCSSYLHIAKTTTTTTVFKPETTTFQTTTTATQTSTSISTELVTTTLTTKTTFTSVSTTTTTSPTSTFTTTIFTTPGPGDPAFPLLVKARQAGYHHNQYDCPDLSKKYLEYRPSVLLHFACACLGIYPSDQHTSTSTQQTTTTVTTIKPKFITITTTTTTTTTSTTPTTTTKSTTTTTTTTSTTSPVVATATAVVNYCDISYSGGGITPGNTILEPGGNSTLTGRECCIICFDTLNCVASAVGLGYCQLLVKTEPLNGTSTSNQCPLGIEDYPVEPGPGTLYLGPCGTGTNKY
ncbi:hypothetical protein V8F06_011244 [Rhypophila decipiens]